MSMLRPTIYAAIFFIFYLWVYDPIMGTERDHVLVGGVVALIMSEIVTRVFGWLGGK